MSTREEQQQNLLGHQMNGAQTYSLNNAHEGSDIDALLEAENSHKIKINSSDSANKKLANTIHSAGGQTRGNATTQESEEIAEAFQASQLEDKSAPEMEFPDEMTILQCFWMVTKMAVPLVCGMLLYLLVQLTNTYFVGNLNEPALLAGVGMGNMLINVLCFAVTQGLNGALETLVSQSYGAQKYQECGIFLNRGKVVCTLIMIPIVVIYVLSDKILIALDQDPEISIIARRYCCILIPGIWAQSMFDATRKFLSAQFETSMNLYVQAVTLVFHFLWCYLFITVWGGREVGAAMATNITYIMNMVLIDLYCLNNDKIKRTHQGLPDSSSFKNIGSYLAIGIPGACMLCFEWWCFELLAIFSGLMGVEALAAEVIVVNLVTLVFMVPLGTGYAASAFTGYFLGQKKIDKAKKYSRLTLVFNILVTIVILIILYTAHDSIAAVFTQDAKTVAIVNDVLVILELYIFFDTIHGVQSGIIRGLGLQVAGSIYTLVCYYLIGLPLALWLAFTKEKGVYGLWLGFSIACIILDCGFMCIIECPDWRKISDKIQSQIDKDLSKKVTDSIKVGKKLRDEEYAGQAAASMPAKNFQRIQSIENSTKISRRHMPEQSR